MKNILSLVALLFALSFMSCEKEIVTVVEPDATEATILGRWKVVGFDDVIRYEFTENKRFTIYSADGTFPSLEEFRQENPELKGNDWVYEGETVVVDLNFGNYSRLVPHFKCGNFVMDWMDEEGNLHSTYYRENYDISDCN